MSTRVRPGECVQTSRCIARLLNDALICRGEGVMKGGRQRGGEVGADMIETNIRFNHRFSYRLIGRDLYAVAGAAPLDDQEYELVLREVVDNAQADLPWRVVIEDGSVCLDL